jgi:hypothetical protein
MLSKALGKAYRLIDKKPEKAEEELLSLIEDYPYYFDAYSCLSELYRRQQKLHEALAIVELGYLKGKALFPKSSIFPNINSNGRYWITEPGYVCARLTDWNVSGKNNSRKHLKYSI